MILANFDNRIPTPKERTITISCAAVLKDIDLLTHKYSEGSGLQDNRVRDAITSDSAESIDATVIARYVEFRDAHLRTIMQCAMPAKGTIEEASDDISNHSDIYRYVLTLPAAFNDNTLRPLAEYIHRYLVWGALYDWYAQFGSAQARNYGFTLNDLEDRINSILRGPSIVKRPLQPFGPADKY